MTTVTLDRNMIERLLDLKEELKLCDEAGKTLGHFIPEKKVVPFSEEELDEFEKDLDGSPLADILRDLGKA
jgi:hypothetical protein